MVVPARHPDLASRVVLVTGGATGIGAAIVTAFARQGARVAFLDVEDAAAADLMTANRTGGHDVHYRRCDATDVMALRATIDAFRADLGPIDSLIANAANDERHTTADLTADAFDSTIAINLKHVVFAAQAVLPDMVAARRGSIVTFSSISWMTASGGMPIYTAAKSAMLGFTRSIARDYGVHGIRANAVAPGWIDTPRQRARWIDAEGERRNLEGQCLKRWIMPDEVASVVVFLASDAASAITAQHIVIDGGRT